MLIDQHQSRPASGEIGLRRSANPTYDTAVERAEQLATLRQAVSQIERKQADFRSAALPIGLLP